MKDLSVMLKPSSSLCNLRCKYCFYHSVAEARESFDYGFMTDETAEQVIINALSYADGGSVYFSFQGGEPLLSGMDFFKNFIQIVKLNNTKNAKIYYAMQTNGTLLDGEWARFLKENDFLVGLSLDGNQRANKNRVDGGGNYVFGSIIESAELLKKYGVDFNILTVLTGYIADNIEEVYRFFKDKGFKYLQFIPCLRPFGSGEEDELYMTPEQYGTFLIRLFNLYVKDYINGSYISVRQLDNFVRLYLGENAEQCGMMGSCTSQFVVEGDGGVYPCDFYCTDERRLGNINSSSFAELAKTPKAIAFLQESLTVDPRCASCRLYPLCRGGGCKRVKADRDYCGAYKRFFTACLPLFRVFINEKNKAKSI